MKAPERKSVSRVRWAALGLFLVLVAIAAIACGTARAADSSLSPVVVAVASTSSGRGVLNAAPATSGSPAANPSPTASPTATPTQPVPLEPAKAGADPLSLLAWLFTPIFQSLFLLLATLYMLTGNVVIAIVIMTLIIRVVTMRLSAKQIVSQKRMQMLAPELRELTKELQRRYKGDRAGRLRGHAGVLQGARRQPHGRLSAVDPADGPAFPDVLGHP